MIMIIIMIIRIMIIKRKNHFLTAWINNRREKILVMHPRKMYADIIIAKIQVCRQIVTFAKM